MAGQGSGSRVVWSISSILKPLVTTGSATSNMPRPDFLRRPRFLQERPYRSPARKLSTRNLERFCRETATTDRTLVVHSEDVDYKPYFPNAYTVTKREDVPADLHVDRYYRGLSEIDDQSFPVILCTGLLEHIPDPQRLINQIHRILEPGGRLIISASAVFSFHEGPDNFFHFTPFGFEVLFEGWDRFELLRGSSGPFETIGILLQRILMQTQMHTALRPVVLGVARRAHILDRFVRAQYMTVQHRGPSARIDSMMPSNIQAVVVK
jgi:SAM-dependent methyltransferase